MGISEMFLIIDFILPIVMISAGYYLYKRPPEINITFIGTDIKLLRGIIEYWRLSQSIPGKLLLRRGIILFVIGDILYVVACSISLMVLEISSIIFIVIEILTLIYTFYDVSKRLCNAFKEYNKI